MFVYCKKTFLIVSSILPLFIFALVNVSLAEIAVIKIHFSDASELPPMVETLLSSAVKASVDTGTDLIIIKQGRESLDKIREVLALSDNPDGQVRIRLRFQERDCPEVLLMTRRERSLLCW